MSCKKLKHIALERNKPRCAAHVIEMAQYMQEQIGFLDETLKNRRTPSRGFGRSKKGKWAQKKQVFLRGQCVLTEALLTIDGIVSGTAVEGSMTWAMFLDWMEFSVVSATFTFSPSCTNPTEVA
jgi:hypothetical protein